MKSSATLESDGVSEIGLSSFLGFTTCFNGSGVTSACFQADGNFCSLYDEFRTSAMCWSNSSAYSVKNQLDRPSGPGPYVYSGVRNFHRLALG